MYYGYIYNYSTTEKVSEDTNKSTPSKVNLPPQITERVGCVNRNEIGFLLWDKDEARTLKWQLGSRLKTPTLPMWVTKVNGSYGVLFNPNRELMRSYAAENR